MCGISIGATFILYIYIYPITSYHVVPTLVRNSLNQSRDSHHFLNLKKIVKCMCGPCPTICGIFVFCLSWCVSLYSYKIPTGHMVVTSGVCCICRQAVNINVCHERIKSALVIPDWHWITCCNSVSKFSSYCGKRQERTTEQVDSRQCNYPIWRAILLPGISRRWIQEQFAGGSRCYR